MNNKIIVSLIFIVMLGSCKSKEDKIQLDRIYFENGQLRREVKLVNGMKQGIMTDYYNDGKLKSIRSFHNNIQVGKTIFYHNDGISIREVQYYDEKGLRTNGDTIWYLNGKIEFMADFKNGKKNGNLARFDSTGQILYKAVFANDTLCKVLK